MELIFDFVDIDPENSDYTVTLSTRDAEMLGSATESQPRTRESVPDFQDSAGVNGPRYKFFLASNFIDTIDGDEDEPIPPCLEDPVMLRSPDGDVSQLLPAGHCIDSGWQENIYLFS